MKSNLRRKLFLSLAATAACAATLTSTTFAWYTSNATVTTDTVNAATESTTDTGSIYIANATSYGANKRVATLSQYSSSATPVLVNSKTITIGTTGEGENAVPSNTVLKPVYYNGSTYRSMSSAEASYVAVTGKAASGVQYYVEHYASSSELTAWASNTTYYTKNGDSYDPVDTGTLTDPAASTTYYWKDGTYDTTTVTANSTIPAGTFIRETVTYENESSANQMEFVYRLRTANAGTTKTVYFKDFSLINTTGGATTAKSATLPSQTAMVYNRAASAQNVTPAYDAITDTGITEAGAYKVDLLNALKLTLTVTNLGSDGEYVSENEVATTKIYSFGDYAMASTHVNISQGNAIGYYNRATGHNISAPAGYNASTLAETALYSTQDADDHNTALSFDIPASGYVEVRFVFWLDGWDEYCYDTCRQQTFSFHTDFTTTSGDASVWKA